VFEKRLAKRPKVAIFTEKKWAFGRIHTSLIKHMSHKYDFEFFDWQSRDDCARFFRDEEWKHFDIILGNSVITYSQVEAGWQESVPQEYLDKCIAVSHAVAFNHPGLKEFVNKVDGPLYCGVSQQVVDQILSEHGIEAEVTPNGVDPEHFFPTREIKNIKRAGIIGNPDNSVDIKRVDMFRDICEKAGLEPVFIFGNSFELNHHLYEGIDVLMYTSSSEGAGLGILEASMCGIPVITTKVGYSLLLKNVKTFDTVDEAVELVKWLDAGAIQEYTDAMMHEIKTEWNWDLVCEKYWLPVFEKRLLKNLDAQ
jgi:glycosyltransferase involved in cell wall biosynthesis